jgi:hypothetical protein
MKKKTSYSEKLLDPRWQRKRLEIFNRDNWQCKRCDTTHKTLHVHHKKYESGREPWEYENELLVTLCADCHEHETLNYNEELNELIDFIKIKLTTNGIFYLSCILGNYKFERSHDDVVRALDFVCQTKYLNIIFNHIDNGDCPWEIEDDE